MKKLLLLLFLIPNLAMAENLSLVCKGLYEVKGEVNISESDTRTYIFEDEKLIKANELFQEKDNWKYYWSKSEIYCENDRGAIRFDRLSGNVKSYILIKSQIHEFKGLCEVATERKF